MKLLTKLVCCSVACASLSLTTLAAFAETCPARQEFHANPTGDKMTLVTSSGWTLRLPSQDDIIGGFVRATASASRHMQSCRYRINFTSDQEAGADRTGLHNASLNNDNDKWGEDGSGGFECVSLNDPSQCHFQ